MVTLQVNVDVTEDREVTIKLPDDFPLGEAKVTIAVEPEEGGTLGDALPLTDDEISSLLQRKSGKTGAEIAASGLIGSWKHKGIMDSVTWVEEQRRKREERHQW